MNYIKIEISIQFLRRIGGLFLCSIFSEIVISKFQSKKAAPKQYGREKTRKGYHVVCVIWINIRQITDWFI